MTTFDHFLFVIVLENDLKLGPKRLLNFITSLDLLCVLYFMAPILARHLLLYLIVSLCDFIINNNHQAAIRMFESRECRDRDGCSSVTSDLIYIGGTDAASRT